MDIDADLDEGTTTAAGSTADDRNEGSEPHV
jgi:hypothetical protein